MMQNKKTRPRGRITFSGPMLMCSCGNRDQDKFATIVSGTGYRADVRQLGNHGDATLEGYRCVMCGATTGDEK